MCMGTSPVCTTISTANLKLVANSSAAERSISYPHKEGPRRALNLYSKYFTGSASSRLCRNRAQLSILSGFCGCRLSSRRLRPSEDSCKPLQPEPYGSPWFQQLLEHGGLKTADRESRQCCASCNHTHPADHEVSFRIQSHASDHHRFSVFQALPIGQQAVVQALGIQRDGTCNTSDI